MRSLTTHVEISDQTWCLCHVWGMKQSILIVWSLLDHVRVRLHFYSNWVRFFTQVKFELTWVRKSDLSHFFTQLTWLRVHIYPLFHLKSVWKYISSHKSPLFMALQLLLTTYQPKIVRFYFIKGILKPFQDDLSQLGSKNSDLNVSWHFLECVGVCGFFSRLIAIKRI